MDERMPEAPPEVLLVEDNPGDVRLAVEALRGTKLAEHLHVVNDGAEALAFLHHEGTYQDAPRPDLILLDLNLPRKDGREVLAEIKRDDDLRMIPVVVWTTSGAGSDIQQSYSLHANCYVRKPLDLDQFFTAVRSIEQFWVETAKLPKSPVLESH